MELKAKNSTNLESKCSIKSRQSKVTHIYKNDRQLKEIPKVSDTKYVLVIYLHNNLICKLQHLNGYRNLTHLYLQWNKIKIIENLQNLKRLKKLYLGYNEISVIEKLDELPNLEELHIERQNLECGDTIIFEPRCLEILGRRVTVLNVSGNKLNNLCDVFHLEKLCILIAKDNSFEDHEKIAEGLSSLLNLREVIFLGNPMCANHRYKEVIIGKCFKLEKLDNHNISDERRMFLKCFDEKRTSNMNMNLKSKSMAAIRISAVPSQDSLMSTKSESPNTHLMELETKRQSAAKARQLRLSQLDCSNGQIPRCFWRNKTSDKSKEHQEQVMGNISQTQIEEEQIWP